MSTVLITDFVSDHRGGAMMRESSESWHDNNRTGLVFVRTFCCVRVCFIVKLLFMVRIKGNR